MKLTKEQIEIMRGARALIEAEERGENAYICFAINDAIEPLAKAETRLLKNRIFFWRKTAILEEWDDRGYELKRAVSIGIRGHSTVGVWFDLETDKVGINLEGIQVNNLGLYKQIRLAWLDRSIETGELV